MGFDKSSVGFLKNEDFNQTCFMECCCIDNYILICVLSLGREFVSVNRFFSCLSTDFLYDCSMGASANKIFDFYSFTLTRETFKNTSFQRLL